MLGTKNLKNKIKMLPKRQATKYTLCKFLDHEGLYWAIEKSRSRLSWDNEKVQACGVGGFCRPKFRLTKSYNKPR